MWSLMRVLGAEPHTVKWTSSGMGWSSALALTYSGRNPAALHFAFAKMARSHSRKIIGLVLVVAAALGSWFAAARFGAASARKESAQLASVLGLREGSRVADIGAGKGKYAVELARLVGPTGHVFATEIDSKRRRQIGPPAATGGKCTQGSWG